MFDFAAFIGYFDNGFMLGGAAITVGLTLASLAGGLWLGMGLAGRRSGGGRGGARGRGDRRGSVGPDLGHHRGRVGERDPGVPVTVAEHGVRQRLDVSVERAWQRMQVRQTGGKRCLLSFARHSMARWR